MSFRDYIQQIIPVNASKEALLMQEEQVNALKELKEVLIENQKVKNEKSGDSIKESLEELAKLIGEIDAKELNEKIRELNEILTALNKSINTTYKNLPELSEKPVEAGLDKEAVESLAESVKTEIKDTVRTVNEESALNILSSLNDVAEKLGLTTESVSDLASLVQDITTGVPEELENPEDKKKSLTLLQALLSELRSALSWIRPILNKILAKISANEGSTTEESKKNTKEETQKQKSRGKDEKKAKSEDNTPEKARENQKDERYKEESTRNAKTIIKTLQSTRKDQMATLAANLALLVAIGALGMIFKKEIGQAVKNFVIDLVPKLTESLENLLVRVGILKEQQNKDTGETLTKKPSAYVEEFLYRNSFDRANTEFSSVVKNRKEGESYGDVLARRAMDESTLPKEYRTGVFAGSTSPTTPVKQRDGTWGETETKGSLWEQYNYNVSKVKPEELWKDPLSHLKKTVGLIGKRASETGYELKVRQDGGSVDAARADLYRSRVYGDIVEEIQEEVNRYLKSGILLTRENVRYIIEKRSRGKFSPELVTGLAESIDLDTLAEKDNMAVQLLDKSISVLPYLEEGAKMEDIKFTLPEGGKVQSREKVKTARVIASKLDAYVKNRTSGREATARQALEVAGLHLPKDIKIMSDGEINEVIEALVKGTSGLSSHSDEEKKLANYSDVQAQVLSETQVKVAVAMNQRLAKEGFTAVERQAIIQQAYYESSLDPTAINPSGGAYGLFQLLGPRKTAYNKFKNLPENRGRSELDMQMDFFIHETETTEKVNMEKAGFGKGLESAAELGAGFQAHVQRSAFYGEGDIDMRQVAGLQTHNKIGRSVASIVGEGGDTNVYQDLSHGRFHKGTKSSYRASGGYQKEIKTKGLAQNYQKGEAWLNEWRSRPEKERYEALRIAKKQGWAIASSGIYNQEMQLVSNINNGTPRKTHIAEPVIEKPQIAEPVIEKPQIAEPSGRVYVQTQASPLSDLTSQNMLGLKKDMQYSSSPDSKRESMRVATPAPNEPQEFNFSEKKEEPRETKGVNQNNSSSVVVINKEIKQPQQPVTFD